MPIKQLDEERVLAPEAEDEEGRVELSLRPTQLADFVGQPQLVSNLEVYVRAARKRGGALDREATTPDFKGSAARRVFPRHRRRRIFQYHKTDHRAVTRSWDRF